MNDTTFLNIDGGEIVSNVALNKDAKPSSIVARGGGVYVGKDVDFVMYDGKVSGNRSNGHGGGIYLSQYSRFTMMDGELNNNTAEGGSGGGLCNEYYSGSLPYTPGFVKIQGGEISWNVSSSGGGLSLSADPFTMSGGTISNNEAYFSGGGIGTTAPSEMSGGLITKNKTTLASTFFGGGGVYSFGAFTMSGGTISENTTAGTGGGVHMEDNGPTASYKPNFTMKGGIITKNTANGPGTGNWMNSGGGGVYLGSTAPFTMTGGTISENTVINGSGGGIHLRDGSKFVMDPDPAGPGAKVINNEADSHGGGIVAVGANAKVEIMDGEISENKAEKDGGGIYIDSASATLTMHKGSITRNTAKNAGGGVCTAGAFTMHDGTITHNKALDGLYGQGGGVTTANVFTMKSGMISQNTAATDGGGVFVRLGAGSALVMEGGTISGNTAGTDGGGIFYADAYPYANPVSTGKYKNLSIASGAVVQNNTASQVFVPPVNRQAFTSRATNPFDGTLLDNNNINYKTPPVDVTVAKTVQGAAGDRNKMFTFTITVEDADGNPLPQGTEFTYTGGTTVSGVASPGGGTLRLNNAGSATFQLKHGQTITVENIPYTYKVYIAETADVRYTTTYTLDGGSSVTDTDTGPVALVDGGDDRRVDFVNTRITVVETGVSDGMTGAAVLPGLLLPLLAGTAFAASRKARRKRHG